MNGALAHAGHLRQTSPALKRQALDCDAVSQGSDGRNGLSLISRRSGSKCGPILGSLRIAGSASDFSSGRSTISGLLNEPASHNPSITVADTLHDVDQTGDGRIKAGAVRLRYPCLH
jgi:hypothetical protein